MSKQDTQYFENERELQKKHLSNFGLNPHACELLVKSYIQHCAPKPVSLDYFIDIEGSGREHVELELRTPGFVGAGKGDANKLDKFGLRHFARSYFEDVSPHPVSFLFHKVEVHIRTPGISDNDRKNIARDIYNPTK